MKIGLIDADGHNFPNLALMKITSFHRRKGDTVEWANIGNYDITYISKIFTFSPEPSLRLGNYGEIIRGGTGFHSYELLKPEIDILCPDYSIYPKFTAAYGFLTRGCVNNCSWCIVPRKEGAIYAYSDIEDWLNGRKEAIIMDNNILAHEHGISQLEKIVKLGIKIDINQGMEARLISPEIAQLLSKIKFIKFLRMACDTKAAITHVESAVKNLSKYGVKPYRVFCYVLVKDVEDALYRIKYLHNLGVIPFAQPYRDFTNTLPVQEAKDLARWCNHRAIFKSCDFRNYRPRKGNYIHTDDSSNYTK
ncbi:hypothetical protein EZS27_006065 [termite gut metagenome]|uniref:Radical SAM core domain-containing protein n=1 Tax=termite gut metagenome TaxID=433724 RepID=A0A5J4SMK6_9ZZZZ